MAVPAFADILLIEHDPFEAELTITAILQSKLTDKIHWVKDAEEAIHFIFGHGKYVGRNIARLPRIIIIDLSISQESGIEVLNIIRGNPFTKSIAVFVFSGLEESESFADAIKAGVNMCMVKANDFDEFAEKLKQELGYYWRLFEAD
ncbi:MAG: response regulator [Bacteroidia bacterium]